ncbi:MAG: phosphohistidine phosphatase SixA [Vicinamibacterales bacterium]
MQLYLIRHGVAADRGDDYPDDAKRPLTAEGMSRLRKQTKALNALGVSVDVIIASPLMRTRQTADIIAAGLSGKPAIVLSDALTPEGTPDAVLAELAKHAKKSAVALVGHEPNLGELAAQLIGARCPLEFKKGGICRIDFEAFPPKETGRLRFFLPPRLLRQLA